jgi:hypothetical protein
MLESLGEALRTPIGGSLFFGVLVIWPYWRIFLRAGLTPLWALLVFVPIIGQALVLAALALQAWPALGGATLRRAER